MNERQKFDKLLQIYSTLQPFRAPDFTNHFVLDYWFGEFGSIPLNELKKGLDHWIRNETWFPSISDLRKALGAHDEDPETESRQIVAKVQTAMRKFGYMREKEAREWLGELSWSVVNGVGGWQFISDLTTSNHATVTAQMRELAKSLLTTKKYPQNDSNKFLLQEKAKQAIEIATNSSAVNKRIGNSGFDY